MHAIIFASVSQFWSVYTVLVPFAVVQRKVFVRSVVAWSPVRSPTPISRRTPLLNGMPASRGFQREFFLVQLRKAISGA